MAALGDTRQAEQAAGSNRRRYCQAPAPGVSRQKGESDEREAERSMAGAERAVALALACRDERRGELPVAAELDDLRRPRPPPMVLENGVDQNAGTEREDKDEVESRPGIAAQQGSPGDVVAGRGRGGKQQNGTGEIRRTAEEQAYRHRIGEEEAAAGAIEEGAEPEVDVGHGNQQDDRRAAGEAKDEPRSHPILRAGASTPMRRLISAPARAVSFGG